MNPVSLKKEKPMAADFQIEQLTRRIAELERANRAHADFTAMVSHELKTPLAAIKASIDLILDEIDGPVTDGQKETLGITKNNIDRLSKLVSDVLEYERVNSGMSGLRLRQTDLNALISDALSLMRTAIGRKNIQLTSSLPPEPVHATCDADKVCQILINLLDNAVKYTPEGGRIFLSLSADAADAVISVRDNGIGISAGDQRKIFGMFEQASPDYSFRSGSPGAGVGLAVCKKLAEQHGGEISVQGAPGKGAEFTVRLPLA